MLLTNSTLMPGSSRLDRIPEGLSLEDWLLMKEWNQSVPEEYHACIHHVFEQMVDRNPSAPAVCAWDGNLTYDRLDELSSILARYLASQGVKHGVFVPFIFEKSLWTVVATGAILKAGGAYVPIDPSHPPSRLSSMVKDVNANVVVVSQLYTATMAGLAENIVTLSWEFIESLKQKPLSDPTQVTPEDPAVVFFTSGSTGQPKGILLQHSAIVTNARSHGEALDITCDSRVLQFAAHGWDVATMEMWTTLMRGGCVCIPSEQERKGDITRAMNRMRVNWALLTPTFAKLLKPEDVPELRILVLAGEAMKQDLITVWADRVRLFNAYGPAETGVCTAVEYKDTASRAESIGKQMKANICWVVDPICHDRLVPIGSVGELVAEGPNIALQYLNDKEKTAKAFIEDPAWLRHRRCWRKRRLYKTGDLVRSQLDGSLDFIGRKDTQVKIRGQRVELGEIETNIDTQIGISQSVVCLPKAGQFRGQLVAVVQFKDAALDQGLNGQVQLVDGENHVLAMTLQRQLMASLRKILPAHMIPGAIIPVQSLPLSLSAKINKSEVLGWLETIQTDDITARNQPPSRTALIDLQDSTTLQIYEALINILGEKAKSVNHILTYRDVALTTIGLDSVQYIQLSMFMYRQFDVELPFSDIIGHNTTISDLAHYIDSAQGRQNGQGRPFLAKDLLEEISMLRTQLLDSVRQPASCQRISNDCQATILVTGSSGFLGTQILRLLLRDSAVRRVVAHVRARNKVHGFERVVSAAKNFRWWQESYAERLEIWVGDLSEPQLGLNQDQWQRLQGQGCDPINAVIHNGANFNWMHDYCTLRSANVMATFELLAATLGSTSISRFVYISGGQVPSFHAKTDEETADEVVSFNGYAQTKFASEVLVRDIGRFTQKTQSNCTYSVVKPGYIIGTSTEGIANPHDFLWRLFAGVLDVDGYNAADQDSYLVVSNVDHVAETIVRQCLDHPSSRDGLEMVQILWGVQMKECWQLLRRWNCRLEPLEPEEWLRRIRKNAMHRGKEHPLYACLPMVEMSKGKLGCQGPSEHDSGFLQGEDVRMAMAKNMEFLAKIGFFHGAHEN